MNWTFHAFVLHEVGRSTIQMTTNRRLKSGRVDFTDLTEDDALKLIEELARAISICRKVAK